MLAPSAHFDRRSEDVAASAHRLDHRRPLRIVLKLSSKPTDLDVDRPIKRASLAIAGEIEQPIAGQHLIGVIDERCEQIEFASGEPDLLSRRR